jgi:ABC-2 type transport system ATP-binding protein
MDTIVIENISKSFGPTMAVDSLSARVSAGSIHGFLGPNGAGKTTTIRMIMDILRPDRGRIEVLGRDPREARRRVGYMPEERGLYRRMTVRQTLEYFGALRGLRGADLARRVSDWLDRMELADRAAMKVEELSRGLHQKLQFAVTCIDGPEVLILDEPLVGLDPVNLDVLKGIILGMRREGKTVLLSTHGMHDAEELCDSILLINKGRLVLEGKLQDVRSRYRSRAVVAKCEPADFLDSLPGVASVRLDGEQAEIALADGADPQDVLAAMVGRARVSSFQVKVPSLHEIFVRAVGGDHA